ncbi:LSU ribosomal protein L15p (L27Ae), partial [Pseudomonas sp. FEN]
GPRRSASVRAGQSGRRHRHRAVPERCQRDQPERTACENHAVGRSDSRSNYQGHRSHQRCACGYRSSWRQVRGI